MKIDVPTSPRGVAVAKYRVAQRLRHLEKTSVQQASTTVKTKLLHFLSHLKRKIRREGFIYIRNKGLFMSEGYFLVSCRPHPSFPKFAPHHFDIYSYPYLLDNFFAILFLVLAVASLFSLLCKASLASSSCEDPSLSTRR